MRAYRDLGDDEDAARRAMRPLEGAGWAIADERSNGKPPKAWAINPRVHAIFGERAQAEKARREAERQKLREVRERIAWLRTDTVKARVAAQRAGRNTQP